MTDEEKLLVASALIDAAAKAAASHPDLAGRTIEREVVEVTPAGAKRLHLIIDGQLFAVLAEAQD
jgi:hypothetical protein